MLTDILGAIDLLAPSVPSVGPVAESAPSSTSGDIDGATRTVTSSHSLSVVQLPPRLTTTRSNYCARLHADNAGSTSSPTAYPSAKSEKAKYILSTESSMASSSQPESAPSVTNPTQACPREVEPSILRQTPEETETTRTGEDISYMELPPAYAP